MTRLLITMMLCICAAFSATAQTGLQINKVFNGRYASDPKVTETFMSGGNNYLKKHKLTVLASFKGPASVYAPEFEKLVLADGASSVGKNVRYKKGKLYFAFYILKPTGNGSQKVNRYLYYLNNSVAGGTNVLILYLEGTASEREVSNLIRNMTR